MVSFTGNTVIFFKFLGRKFWKFFRYFEIYSSGRGLEIEGNGNMWLMLRYPALQKLENFSKFLKIYKTGIANPPSIMKIL